MSPNNNTLFHYFKAIFHTGPMAKRTLPIFIKKKKKNLYMQIKEGANIKVDNKHYGKNKCLGNNDNKSSSRFNRAHLSP
ncbi:hypothetical protein Sjap_025148 [Stephania japonica]|uniref:Uncharacterized protein n=1 Tax=Stephania japonica TaxID=461633 RepID=A0AAP0E5N1_9MAGN